MRKTLCKFSLMCQWAFLFEWSKVHTICCVTTYIIHVHAGHLHCKGKPWVILIIQCFVGSCKAPQIYSTGIRNAARMPSLRFLEWFRNAPILEAFSKNRCNRRLLFREQWGHSETITPFWNGLGMGGIKKTCPRLLAIDQICVVSNAVLKSDSAAHL